MKKITLILFLFLNSISFSQSLIEGFVFDKETKQPLPYATIKILSNNNYYTITNEDGKFEIYNKFAKDSLEIRFIGFKTTKIPVSFFNKNTKLYLNPNSFSLNEVSIVSDKNYVYNLLYNLIKKSRLEHSITKSKAFLTLSSSSKGIPIEHIEGFFNSKQSLSKGLVDLQVKSGRFGQNTTFPFYSINNTDILSDFNLFTKNSNQALPLYPGNMSLSSIKSKYKVKMDICNNCTGDDISISFSPKKLNGRLFQGSILFDSENLKLKKIELEAQNPATKKLSALSEKDVMTPKEIKLNITFNPLDFNKIQHLDFKFSIYYKSGRFYNTISSHSLLYFYDYDTAFNEPFFTSKIHFNNDYDKIIALQATDNFWEINNQFPKSIKKLNSINYLENNGILINFSNKIPSKHIEYIKPSVISWNKNQSLSWNSIKEIASNERKQVDYSNASNKGPTKSIDKISYSIYGLKIKKSNSKLDEVFNFNYMLDIYQNEKGQSQYITRTLFDRNSSFCKFDRIEIKLIYINLIFDIYEVYNQRLKSIITNEMTFDEVKKLCIQKFEEASITVNNMKADTNAGLNYQNLKNWENTIKQKLHQEVQ